MLATSQKCAVGCMLLLMALWMTIKLDHAGYRFPNVGQRTTSSSFPTPAFPCKPLSQKERLDAFGDLQGYTHMIYTSSPETQKAFDTGMMLAYGFNQPEALRSFHQAMEDPTAPAPYWGKAYALGPFLNKIAGPAEGSKAYPVFSLQELENGKKAVEQGLRIADEQMAKQTSTSMSDTHKTLRKLLERDKAYLQGISHVFFSGATHGPAFIAGTKAYAQALEEWAEAHPEDTDALALSAEALANLQPW
ncbi:hypothetical protein DUNSADRAFT_10765 [Dunaliella salina]|uniref:Uncharacterized protein n=1 Tax=Dunaliella salina TaxID=3046 RepID=A0ABQ7GEK6_DUNSA|nr:hypothetical protein DUNSADRAFT_10765 [Dunaliella salina]|eukprot:KAF5833019.1 hypothetical protein DUNSADRAFT_10765 [Dunaliella salina]